MEEFVNRKSFTRWIVTQPKKVNDLLMVRAALRTLPLLTIGFNPDIFSRADVFEATDVFATDRELVLLTFRTLLQCTLIIKIPEKANDFEPASLMLANNNRNYEEEIYFIENAPQLISFKGKPASEAALFAAGELGLDESGIQLSYLRKFGPPSSESVTRNGGSSSFDGNVFWPPFVVDMNVFEGGQNIIDAFNDPLWGASQRPVVIEDEWKNLLTLLGDDPTDWSFWIDWYQRILDGRPQNWEMLEEIALIDPEDWDKGAEHVNGLIAEIQARFSENNKSGENVTSKLPVSSAEADKMIARVEINRVSLVVSIAGVVDQIAEHRERVRGNNHLDPNTRDDLIAFLDELSGQLNELLSKLPMAEGIVSEESSKEYVRWVAKFGSFLRSKALKYVEPENVAEAVIPTGIILGSTGIGAMLGQPLAGAAVGGLITNQMKPGKAAEAILKPDGDGE